MSPERSPRPFAVLALACCLLLPAGCGFDRSTLPSQLTDDEFRTLAAELSEPAGAFPFSDNLVSNELPYAQVIRTLGPMGGVYIGVGPEQNFSYIARLRPAMAFVVDIRVENRDLHLFYKALFEIAADRADFVSRLFSRPRPQEVGAGSSVDELFTALEQQRPQRPRRDDTARLVRARLLDQHRLSLTPFDLQVIDYVLDAFYSDGPGIHYARLTPAEPRGPSYRALMTATDVTGRAGSYLGSEEDFAFVKDLQMRNLVVPIVGDFGAKGALRRTADYIRQHGEALTAFYSSNVEVYLNREKANAFCANLAHMPYGWRTWFIGSKGKQPLRLKLAACTGQDTMKVPPR